MGPFSKFYPLGDKTLKANAHNGLILKTYSAEHYAEGERIGVVAYALGIFYICLSVVMCYGKWKLLGLELFFVLQLCFMSFVALPHLNPYSGNACKIGSVMGWNFVTGQVLPPYQNSAPVLEQMNYSVSFTNNFNIMIIFPASTLLLYLIYRILQHKHTKSQPPQP